MTKMAAPYPWASYIPDASSTPPGPFPAGLPPPFLPGSGPFYPGLPPHPGFPTFPGHPMPYRPFPGPYTNTGGLTANGTPPRSASSPDKSEFNDVPRGNTSAPDSPGSPRGPPTITDLDRVSPDSLRERPKSPESTKAPESKYPDYCQTITVTDSSGHTKELVFPKALDLDRPKRARTTFTSDQLTSLEREFLRNQYLIGRERTDLAKRLGLSETQVKVWFQNRRTKYKRDRDREAEQSLVRAETSATSSVYRLLGDARPPGRGQGHDRTATRGQGHGRDSDVMDMTPSPDAQHGGAASHLPFGR